MKISFGATELLLRIGTWTLGALILPWFQMLTCIAAFFNKKKKSNNILELPFLCYFESVFARIGFWV
jgi:hypothetical protein